MKSIKVVLLIVAVLLISGCSGKKEAIDKDTFTDIMKNQGMAVYDDSSSFDYVEAAYVASTADIKVVYIKGKKKTDIEGTYVDQCDNIYKRALEGYKDSKKSGSNWSTLKITDSENYYYISLIDDTYIYIEGSIDKENKINKIIDNLKY